MALYLEYSCMGSLRITFVFFFLPSHSEALITSITVKKREIVRAKAKHKGGKIRKMEKHAGRTFEYSNMVTRREETVCGLRT